MVHLLRAISVAAAFVTIEGKLLGLDVNELSYSAEDRIKLTASDYVIASFVPHHEESPGLVPTYGSRGSETLGERCVPRLEAGCGTTRRFMDGLKRQPEDVGRGSRRTTIWR